MKLNKFISKYYSKSKKKAEKFILNQKVKVNNTVISDIFYDLKKEDKVYLNNKLIDYQSSGYILYNKPKDVDLNNLPNYVDLFLKDFYNQNNYFMLSLDHGYSGLVLFYDDINFNYDLRKNNIKVIYDITLKNKLNDDQRKSLIDDLKNIDQYSEVNLSENNTVGIKTLIVFEELILSELYNYNYSSIDRVLISNLDKFEVPRGKFKKLNNIEILNFKSLSTSPNKSSS
tara:strand:+ start:2402 stop:3088 length:687 start_codon:yes stop_codon:yes gene_type:complete